MKKDLIALMAAGVLAFSTATFADKPAKLEKVNINTATIQELDEHLDGVGKKVAMAIVEHREKHGPFKNMKDLDKVKYIGDSIIKKNETRILFE